MTSLVSLGTYVSATRRSLGLTQGQLAERAGVSRSAVALLEQGRRAPGPSQLKQICSNAGVPEEFWKGLCSPAATRRVELEALVSEMVGRVVSLDVSSHEEVLAAEASIESLLTGAGAADQMRDNLNSVLVFYGVQQVSAEFFEQYFTQGMSSLGDLQGAVKAYQMEAMRLFATFQEAYHRMNEPGLRILRAPLAAADMASYTQRTRWGRISVLDEDRLPDLGYIAAADIRRETTEREVLSKYLNELAESVRSGGRAEAGNISRQRQRKMDTLLRKFDSTLKHTPISPLFTPDPAELEREAERLAPTTENLERIERTQAIALQNLAAYLTADHMDVYVATSMRTRSDFVSVNRFVDELFELPQVECLHLRYFNPTQSWIRDRVAKGLVEALMLRRAKCAIYMAQKSDSFGKDSEASVALGQGKPVIVYVPKLVVPSMGIDSEHLETLSIESLRAMVRDLRGEEVDETLDQAGVLGQYLEGRLESATDEALCEAVRTVWADFALYDEFERFQDPENPEFSGRFEQFLSDAIGGPVKVPRDIRTRLVNVLVSNTVRFAGRAKLFREIHPLALQVILSTGVLNGILVVRSVESCGNILRRVLGNNLELALEVDEDNYRLVEVSTRSTIRVISRNHLVANAFSAFYRRVEGEAVAGA